jgi:hypothetical protein
MENRLSHSTSDVMSLHQPGAVFIRCSGKRQDGLTALGANVSGAGLPFVAALGSLVSVAGLSDDGIGAI